ncbi:MAG: 5'/3'-nucleotidase SurE [Proteobacteria bacterium]|nr:5'/3'-nucleotidase SurE [Pseudomonadota bacterium]
MRILLTNDDGIAAEGLAALERIARALSDDVWIVAPELEQSGQSRALTLTAPIRVRELGPKRFAVGGTPTDCVILAVQDVMDGPPDLVLSGINRGQNLAEDVTFSGTVAGALAAMALGVRGIALSQALSTFHDDEQALYATPEHHAPGLIRALLAEGWPPNVVINLNFPDVPPHEVRGTEVTVQGFRDVHHTTAYKRQDLRGRPYYWMGFHGVPHEPAHGTDLAAVREGRISVTPLHIDLTHRETVHRLQGLFGALPPSKLALEEAAEGRADG